VQQIIFKTNTTVRMTTTKQYDFLNRLQSIFNSPSADSPISFAYAYNNVNQRTRMTLADGSFWQYTYDPLGQVISGHKFFADQTPVAGQLFDYSFDDIGNRTQTLAGGDQNGADQRFASYGANSLNQYTNRDVPGFVDIMGLAYATNPVTVNGQTAYRHGEYFRQQLPIGNSSSAQWTNITVSAPGQTTITGYQFLAKALEAITYDADGNLTSDGRWNYGWDAENRLVAMTNNNATVGPQQVLHFEYDWKSRRIRKQVFPTGSATATNDLKFVYDAWNLLAELSSTNSAARTYVCGLDLSGSLQGAGGVGGLLEINYYGSQATNCFVAFDGNGSVAALANAADGTSPAQYEYSPFGELLRTTGPIAKANPFRFSSRRQDDDTDLAYYGYRYYSAITGRWLGRDPIVEGELFLIASGGKRSPILTTEVDVQQLNSLLIGPGGLNAYSFVGNEPLTKIDRLGLSSSFSWGTPGGFTGTWGAYGPFYNPEPPWFMHPADEGKPCCCSPPAKIKVIRTDTVGVLQIVMSIDLQITGCYKDLFVIWDTCWRSPDAPWDTSESGALWQDVNSPTAVLEAYGTMYRTKAHVRLLSCEDGKWKVRGAKAGRGYIRPFPGLPWQHDDSTTYY
jgi:RHS repeat-associated protein